MSPSGTMRAILIAGVGAVAAGIALPALNFALFWLAGRLFDLYDVAFGLALILLAITGILVAIGVGVSAGHLAARLDVQRPRVSAAIASALASAILLAVYIMWTGDLFFVGTLMVVAIAMPVSVIVAGHRSQASPETPERCI